MDWFSRVFLPVNPVVASLYYLPNRQGPFFQSGNSTSSGSFSGMVTIFPKRQPTLWQGIAPSQCMRWTTANRDGLMMAADLRTEAAPRYLLRKDSLTRIGCPNAGPAHRCNIFPDGPPICQGSYRGVCSPHSSAPRFGQTPEIVGHHAEPIKGRQAHNREHVRCGSRK